VILVTSLLLSKPKETTKSHGTVEPVRFLRWIQESLATRLATLTEISISSTPIPNNYLNRATTASFRTQFIISYSPYTLTPFRLSHLLHRYLNHKYNIYVQDSAHLAVCTICRLAIALSVLLSTRSQIASNCDMPTMCEMHLNAA